MTGNITDELANWVLRINNICTDQQTEIERLKAALTTANNLHDITLKRLHELEREIVRLRGWLYLISHLDDNKEAQAALRGEPVPKVEPASDADHAPAEPTDAEPPRQPPR